MFSEDEKLMMRLSAFYTRYNAVLDDLELDSWPEFFSDDCLYRVTTQENWERDLPLSTMMGDSRGMLEDRVSAIQNSMTYAPRAYRRFQSGLRIIGSKPDALKVKSNFLVVQTLSDQQSEVAFCGVAHDTLTPGSGDAAFMFRERVCVMDTEMIPNSLVYPI